MELNTIRRERRRRRARNREVISVAVVPDPTGQGFDILRPIKAEDHPAPKPAKEPMVHYAAPGYQPLTQVDFLRRARAYGSCEHRKVRPNSRREDSYPRKDGCWKDYPRRAQYRPVEHGME